VRHGDFLFVSFIFTDLAPWETLSELKDLAMTSAMEDKFILNMSHTQTGIPVPYQDMFAFLVTQPTQSSWNFIMKE
jgi:hypothetical protein